MKKYISFLIAFCLLFSFSAFGNESYALMVSDVPVTRTEAYIYILNAEEEYAQIVEYYKTYLGVDFWEMEYTNGSTVSQMVKSDVFKEILMMNVFFSMANEKHLSLTDAEKSACRADAEKTYALLPVATASLIDKEALVTVFEKQRLADRMYSMLLSETEIDEEAIASSIQKSANKTYEVEYLFRSLTDYTHGASAQPISPEKEKAVLDAFEKARTLDNLKDAPTLYASLDIFYASASFSSDDAEIEQALIDEVRRLSPGETGRTVKTDYGLFLIRLIDDSGTQAYESALMQALRTAREEAFSESYNQLFMDAEYEINVSFWDTVMPGMMTRPD